MKNLLLWVWQLPQHLLALALIRLLGAKKCLYQSGATGDLVRYYWLYIPSGWFSAFISGVSLGQYIILPEKSADRITILHEHGHSRQSAILGLLYLIVVGIPSVLGNLWDRLLHRSWTSAQRQKWYYSRWPEKQADRLGGVKREQS